MIHITNSSKFSRRKKTWIIILVVILLAILNPGYTDFKEYTGLTGKDTEHLHKKYNFFICSIYENDLTTKKYLAILLNFINISPGKENSTPADLKEKAITDTTK